MTDDNLPAPDECLETGAFDSFEPRACAEPVDVVVAHDGFGLDRRGTVVAIVPDLTVHSQSSETTGDDR